MIDQLLADKCKIEAEMRTLPSRDTLRQRYFKILYTIARSHFGIFFANFPEIATPLMFRGGSSDIFNLDQVFLEGQYNFEVPRPNRIMDLGAYVGYTTVLFANRFPDANIVAVEPPGSNFDCLKVNCAAYPNIRCLSGAVWYERTPMRVSEYIFGDWGTIFEPVTGPPAATDIAGYTIGDILEMQGWRYPELIKCSSHRGRVDLLIGDRPEWLRHTTCIITRPEKGEWLPGAEEGLLSVFPSLEFEKTPRGPLVSFTRRGTSNPAAPSSPVLRLMASPPNIAHSGCTELRMNMVFTDSGIPAYS